MSTSTRPRVEKSGKIPGEVLYRCSDFFSRYLGVFFIILHNETLHMTAYSVKFSVIFFLTQANQF